ncbi:MAG: response regulator [Acidobacteriaceae bacterium]
MAQAATLLCIDDEVLGLEIRRVVLEREGYVVLTANDGAAGLALFGQNQVDAVILDYAMPDMDGAQVAQALRRIRPGIPILLLSAYLSLPPMVTGMVDIVANKGDGALSLLACVRDLVALGTSRG